MEVSPLCIILVKSDSKGDRLLFRYPFQIEENNERTNKCRKNPYTLPVVEELLQNVTMSTSSNNINKGILSGFVDEVLSSLFAVKMDLCDKNFELKVNDVRFVSLPTYLHLKHKQSEKDDSSFMILNIVFALSALASRSVVECYHSLCLRIGVILKHEERRRGYVSEETQIMMAAHDDDDDTTNNNETAFQVILDKCTLAKNIRKMYEDLCSTGLVNIILNKWIPLTFCLPQKVHQWHLRGKIVEPEDIDRCVSSLKPYHSLLLLYPVTHVINFISLDGSPSLVRMLSQYSPLKNLQMLATDSDLSLIHVFKLTSHLVYWAKATVIFPICSKNKYVIASDAPIHLNSHLVEQYAKEFSGSNLLVALSQFSLPTSLGQKTNPLLIFEPKFLVRSLIWMLQHHLLVQLHTYIQFMPTENGASDHSNGIVESKETLLPNATESSNSAAIFSEFMPENKSTSNLEQLLEFVKMRSEYEDKCLKATDEEKQEYHEDFADLPEDERNQIFKLPASSNSEDLKLFGKLYRKGYFEGNHHIEEIMYLENVHRSQLMQLLDKFREVLVTFETEDLSIALFSTNFS